ncbi:MAG: hypothetical protein AVDCRST_MAG76-527, partial [uncultured Acidimicrobiales bacterium]
GARERALVRPRPERRASGMAGPSAGCGPGGPGRPPGPRGAAGGQRRPRRAGGPHLGGGRAAPRSSGRSPTGGAGRRRRGGRAGRARGGGRDHPGVPGRGAVHHLAPPAGSLQGDSSTPPPEGFRHPWGRGGRRRPHLVDHRHPHRAGRGHREPPPPLPGRRGAPGRRPAPLQRGRRAARPQPQHGEGQGGPRPRSGRRQAAGRPM